MMNPFFSLWMMPVIARKNQGATIFIKGLLFSPLILIPLLWLFLRNLNFSIMCGVGVPLGSAAVIYWVCYLIYLHLQFSPINLHLLPGLKSRLCYATLILWLGMSVIGALIAGIFLGKFMFWWLTISFLMCYLVMILRMRFFPFIAYFLFMYFKTKLIPFLMPLLNNYTIEACIVNLFFCGGFLFYVCHPTLARADFYRRKFQTNIQISEGKKVHNKSNLLLFIEKMMRSIYLVHFEQRLNKKQTLLCYGLGPKAHWSQTVLMAVAAIVLIIFSQILLFTQTISKPDLSQMLGILGLSISGAPLSFIASTWIAIQQTKKEQALMSLLPYSISKKSSNYILAHYLLKNNLIMLGIFMSILIVAHFGLAPVFIDWISLLLFCSFPLFPSLLRDYSNFSYNINDTATKLIVPYTLIVAVSCANVLYWEISIWLWDGGLIIISILLLIWRWKRMMTTAAPAFPAGRA